MAKKKTERSDAPSAPAAAPRRRTPRATTQPAASEPTDVTAVPEPVHTVADMGAPTGDIRQSSRTLSHEEIAQAAYQRFLARGAQHGRDFDDWLEAERALLQDASHP